jgi:hypothetical protein
VSFTACAALYALVPRCIYEDADQIRWILVAERLSSATELSIRMVYTAGSV